MSVFVSKSGSWALDAGTSPSRADTPRLEAQNLVAGNLVRVVAEFFATTESADAKAGFQFEISAVNADEVERLSPSTGVIQSAAGWQSVTRTTFFTVKAVNNSPTEDIDFEVLFFKGEFEGKGMLRDFLLRAEVVSTVT